MKIAIGLITTKKYRESRLRIVLETWAKDLKDVFIITDEEGSYLNRDLIKACNDSTYESNPYKNYFAIKYFHNHLRDYDWFVILDDDTFLNYKNLESALKEKSEDDFFVLGRINRGSYPQIPDLNYCSGGAGYVFNRRTLDHISDIKEENLFCRFADVCIGQYCRNKMIDLVNDERFHQRDPEYYGASEKEIIESISFHYVFDKEMKRLYDLTSSR